MTNNMHSKISNIRAAIPVRKVPARALPALTGSRRTPPWWFCLGLLVSLGLPQIASADAELMLFPTRVVFEGNRRSVQIDLVNRGDAAGTYRIAFQQKQMDELGRLASSMMMSQASTLPTR